jgi:hypothetical protein
MSKRTGPEKDDVSVYSTDSPEALPGPRGDPSVPDPLVEKAFVRKLDMIILPLLG